MTLRALVFEDEESIRATLRKVLEARGYEVLAFAHPGTCPLHTRASCQCPAGGICADVILSDLDMPNTRGVDFIQSQRDKGCRIQHIALMSGGWTEAELLRAQTLGCKIFRKPFSLREVYDWLAEVERAIDPGRELDTWSQG